MGRSGGLAVGRPPPFRGEKALSGNGGDVILSVEDM
jgi:hypothetical protein